MAKFAANAARDAAAVEKLRLLGYVAVTAWECELSDPVALGKRLGASLPPPP
jgi:G:T-mismatch repair DNA endonuclease (very short patch repair protein)